nr:hypothetical protein [Enterovibrio nigricans]
MKGAPSKASVRRTKQADNRRAPAQLCGFGFKKDRVPAPLFSTQPATCDRQVDMDIPIKPPAVGVQGAEYTDIHILGMDPG